MTKELGRVLERLNELRLSELRSYCERMELVNKKSKAGMIHSIQKAFTEYIDYKERRTWIKNAQIGKGKNATTFLATNHGGDQYAMKEFRKTKSSLTIKNEYELQKMAAKKGISPKLYDIHCDDKAKYIVMERMDEQLYDRIVKQRGVLTKKQQLRILEIFQILDGLKVFHNDANLSNFMIKNRKIYIIDFGLAKIIDKALINRLKTEHPNMKLMLLGVVLKLKEHNVPSDSYVYLKTELSQHTTEKYKI